MAIKNSRPAVVIVLLTHIVLLCISGASCAQRSAEPPFTLKQVGANVWAAISNPKSRLPTGANTGFVIGDDGVAVIDTSPSLDADGRFGTEGATQLLATIRTLTKLPVRLVINTHYHEDHVGANAVFVEAGAIVLAHRNVRGWVHNENLRMFGKDITPEQRAFTTLRKLVSDAQAQRTSGEALADAVMPALSEKYNSWASFKYLARANILDTDAEFSGKKRIPQAQPTK